MQAVILAAGTSTRTRPLTYAKPKPLLPVLGSTIIERNLENLVGLVDEVFIAEYYLEDMIKEHLGDSFQGLRLHHMHIDGTPGTGGTVFALKEHLKPPFLVINGDDLYSRVDLEALVKNERACLLSEDDEVKGSFNGWVIENGKLAALFEHRDNIPERWGVATGAYVLGPEFFEQELKGFDLRKDEFGLPQTLESAVGACDYTVVSVSGSWLPVGYPWDLIDANLALLQDQPEDIQGTVEDGVVVNGKLVLGEGSKILSGTRIEGDVFIGQNCTIGPNVILRDGVVIGNNSEILHGAEVKRSVIMDNVKMHHFGYIGDSVLGSHVNIGAGTSTGNLRHDGKNWTTIIRGETVDTGRRKLGAFIADYSKTGVNSALIGGTLMGPASWTEAGETTSGVLQPFHMGEKELALEKFENLPYYDDVKKLSEHVMGSEHS